MSRLCVNTRPFHRRDLSICGLWYPQEGGDRPQPSMDTEGQVNWYQILLPGSGPWYTETWTGPEQRAPFWVSESPYAASPARWCISGTQQTPGTKEWMSEQGGTVLEVYTMSGEVNWLVQGEGGLAGRKCQPEVKVLDFYVKLGVTAEK